MDLTLFQNKYSFPRFVREKLDATPLDYKAKNQQIDESRRNGSSHRKAAIVLLLIFKENNGQSEYVFQLIKRSQNISQGGDISCPGGMLQPRQDNFLSSFLKTGMLPALSGKMARHIQKGDHETSALSRLFLTTALREAWEEIGLNPLNTKYLGALPSYSLTMFERTIFPLVCVTRKRFEYQLNSEVEKILEIPLSYFFHGNHYATLNVSMSLSEKSDPFVYQTPCLLISDTDGNEDILWGATFNIIYKFLCLIADGSLPSDYSSQTRNKVLTPKYIFPKG